MLEDRGRWLVRVLGKSKGGKFCFGKKWGGGRNYNAIIRGVNFFGGKNKGGEIIMRK